MKFSVLTLLVFVLIFTIVSAEEKETKQGDCTAPKSRLVVFILSLLLGELAGFLFFFKKFS
jgi:hypothetical protein